MGKIYTAECFNCNKIYNFDVGIGIIYSKKDLLNYENDFNLLTLFNEKNRIKELEDILKSQKYDLLNGYGHKIMICDTCKNLYSRFIFTLVDNDNNNFTPKYKCHTCRKKLREILEEEILNIEVECPICRNKMKFHLSGEWN